jgi:hypothetical protein
MLYLGPWAIVPANNGTPDDLPAWAGDELRRRRLAEEVSMEAVLPVYFELRRAYVRLAAGAIEAAHEAVVNAMGALQAVAPGVIPPPPPSRVPSDG